MMWIMITLHCSAIEKRTENELDLAIVYEYIITILS
jgi:hypothetical protein